MKFKTVIAAAFAVALSCVQAFGQATILPPGELCLQATTGINGMVGVLGSITGGSLYTNGTYGGVSLTGGSGSGATANITVSGGIVTAVAVLNPGIQYVVGDVLSALPASIGGSGSGFSVPVASTSINSSLAGGSVAFYIPNTQTFKQTWKNSLETVLNQNPVPLDQNGCAVVYGVGSYSMWVFDSLGNTVYTQLTASTSPVGVYWAGQAAGTPNAITITDPSFSSVDGTTIQFLAFKENTGPTTISVSGGSPISIVKDTSTGPVPLSGGEIGPNNAPMVTYDATNAEFHLVNPATSSSSSPGGSAAVLPPQGYLNLVGQASGDVIQVGDVVGTSTIYYSPFTGSQIPIWNGSSFVLVTFSEMTATLTSAGSAASTIQDECVFSNNGVPTLVTGPSWSVVTAGAGSRGTGAGSPQLTRLNGIWVNAFSIIGYNGLSTYTIPANQCTYVGSISVDATAGQVSAYRSWGQSRKFGVWNTYNRQSIYLKAGDSTSSWVPSNSTGLHPADQNTGNSLSVFTGLPEEIADCQYSTIGSATITNTNTMSFVVGVGYNSTTAISGKNASYLLLNQTGNPIGISISLQSSRFLAPPVIGINTVTALESTNGSNVNVTVSGGTETNMLLAAMWRG